jgi:hypothetical protein
VAESYLGAPHLKEVTSSSRVSNLTSGNNDGEVDEASDDSWEY